MTIRTFEDFASYSGSEPISFTPASDVLWFESIELLPTDVVFIPWGSYSAMSVYAWQGPSAGMYLTMNAGWNQLGSNNVQFAAGGGGIYFGDNLATTANDDSGNSIFGTNQVDAIAGLGGNDTISAGNGDDHILMYPNASGTGYGMDSIDGGGGYDVLIFLNRATPAASAPFGAPTSGVNVNFATGSVSGGYAVSSGATITGIEDVVATDYKDTLTGGALAEVFEGRGGNDKINGGGGNDELWGNWGNDTLNGGNGAGDWAMYDDGGPVIVNLGTGTAANDGYNNTDTLVAIENVLGSMSNDSITGSTAANALDGGDGDDKLWGGGGNDTLAGGLGKDKLWGGAGADRLLGGGGADTLYWTIAAPETLADGGTGTDTLQLIGPGGTLDLTGLAGTKLKGIEKINLAGAADYVLQFTAAELDALSTTSTKLVVTGGEGDVVSSNDGWAQGADDGGFHTYTKGSLILWVDMDIGGTIS